jgi:hypothetical protein
LNLGVSRNRFCDFLADPDSRNFSRFYTNIDRSRYLHTQQRHHHHHHHHHVIIAPSSHHPPTLVMLRVNAA